MASGQTTRRQPAPAECAVAGDRLQGILRAGRHESAAGWQQRGQGDLVATDCCSQYTAGKQKNPLHVSPGEQHCIAPGEQLGAEGIEACAVGFAPSPNHDITGRLVRLDLSAPDFPEPAAQTIAGHRGCLELRNDQSHPWLARLVVHPDHVQVLEAAAAPMSEAAANVGRAGEPTSSRQARRCRQEPPCFEGNETVSRFRPFFRLRDSTARPQRVAIRARNPCLLMRRLFRGRYDGFIPRILQSEPGKLVGRARMGQVERGGRGGEDREEKSEQGAARTAKTREDFLIAIASPPSPCSPPLPPFFACQAPIDIFIPGP